MTRPGSMMTKISVVMPVFDVAPFVEAAIRSVLAQTFTDLELIVVDDGSVDGTDGIVARMRDPRIRLLRREHAGLVAAENAGLEAARGEYVVRADGDDVVLPTLFARQVAALDADPRLLAVGAWSRRFAGKQATLDPPADPIAIRRRLRRSNALSQPVMFRADVVRAIGGFRDVGWEDWDLWIRLARQGELRNIGECLALLRYRPGSLHESASRLAGRRSKLQMRWVALRELGADPISVAGLVRAASAVAFFATVGRALPSPRRPPEPATSEPSVSVVIPSHARPRLLERCLDAVAAQQPQADEVIVIHRTEDAETARLVQAWSAGDESRRQVEVARPGLVPALIAGTEAARFEAVAYLDDDSVPGEGWLREIRLGLLDPSVGAVGGPLEEAAPGGRPPGRPGRVGRVTWYGRVIGRHHLNADHYGDVDWLTGGHMAFRRELAHHDPRLRHASGGLAIANDLDSCLTVRRLGYRVLYSPGAVVRHRSASERDSVLGSRVSGPDVGTSAANHTYALLKYLRGPRRVAFRLYAYLVGSASIPGPGRALLEFFRSPRRASAMVRRIAPTWRGRRDGERMYREWRRTERGGSREGQ